MPVGCALWRCVLPRCHLVGRAPFGVAARLAGARTLVTPSGWLSTQGFDRGHAAVPSIGGGPALQSAAVGVFAVSCGHCLAVCARLCAWWLALRDHVSSRSTGPCGSTRDLDGVQDRYGADLINEGL